MLALWLKDIGAGIATVIFLGSLFWLASLAPAIATAITTLLFGG